eukprot:scaffold1699_cov390-Prasinococcus_capsulatus_cf.AAC.2
MGLTSSPPRRAQAEATVGRFLETARSWGATAVRGIATEVFRRASNGPRLLERFRALGAPMSIISQQQEGLLGARSTRRFVRWPRSGSA